MSEDAKIPLCVDLDDTFIRSDMLMETLLIFIKANPLRIFLLPFFLLKGKAGFKHAVFTAIHPDMENIPVNSSLHEYLIEEKKAGRRIILITASPASVATLFKEKYDVFDEAVGSSEDLNLKGPNKAEYLAERFEAGGYDYAGDSFADIPVWKKARKCIYAGKSAEKCKKIARDINFSKEFTSPCGKTWKKVVKQTRVYQWVKNLLIFIPMLTAHEISPGNFKTVFLAFLAFSFTSSTVYVLNDLMDLDSDRKHLRKRFRPFAAGDLSISSGLLLLLLLPAIAIGILLYIGNTSFMFIILLYFVLTTLYSLRLKRITVLDIILLAVLFTLRLFSGGTVLGLEISLWLLAFSMFIFMSIGILKRYTELLVMAAEKRDNLSGRGYTTEDRFFLLATGTATAFLSVLIFILYLSSEQVRALYARPWLLWMIAPVLIFITMRMWLAATRGQMTDDPIVYLAKDKMSYLLGAVVLAIAYMAS